MSAALRLVDRAEIDSSTRPTFRPSRPTLVPALAPSERPTLGPMSLLRQTEAPATQRSATVHPRLELAAREEAQNLLAALRLNAELLGTLMSSGESSSIARFDALDDLQRGIDSLERRFASRLPLLSR
jgi:hypothetical protein